MFRSKSKLALFLMLLASAFGVGVVCSNASFNAKTLSWGLILLPTVFVIPIWLLGSIYRVQKAIAASRHGWKETIALEIEKRPIPLFPTIQDTGVVGFLTSTFIEPSPRTDQRGEELNLYLEKSEDGTTVVSQLGVDQMTKEIVGHGVWKYPYRVFSSFYENKTIGTIGSVLFMLAVLRVPILDLLRSIFHWK